jgi:hypothetical protein
MTTLIVKKTGNSVTMTWPKETGVKVGQEFLMIPQNNGGILLVPKIDYKFSNVEPNSQKEEEWGDGVAEGKEDVDFDV